MITVARSADWLQNFKPLDERSCRRCRSPFRTGSRTAIYCPACREIVNVEKMRKSNEKRKARRRRLQP